MEPTEVRAGKVKLVNRVMLVRPKVPPMVLRLVAPKEGSMTVLSAIKSPVIFVIPLRVMSSATEVWMAMLPVNVEHPARAVASPEL